MITPFADYAHFLIDCATMDLIKKVQKLQNRGLRICRFNNMYERCSATALHEHFKLPELGRRRFEQLLSLMFKVSSRVGVHIDPENRRTRADEKVKIPIKNYTYKTLQKCPLYRGVWEWDDLNPEVQKSNTQCIFKTHIKTKRARPIII